MTSIQNQCGLKQSFGTIWMNTGNWTGVNVAFSANTYKELASLGTNFTLMSPSNDFAMTTDGRLKYTGINTRNFLINSGVSHSRNTDTSIAIYKNGVLVTGAECITDICNSLTNEDVPVSLSTNDYVSVWLKHSSTINTNIYSVILNAVSII